MLFSLFKHYLELWINDTTLKVYRSLYCFTSISNGVENYFPRLCHTGISDAIFQGIDPNPAIHAEIRNAKNPQKELLAQET